jgi:hypothetical protein
MEKWNDTFTKSLAASSVRERWSEAVHPTVISYNCTRHSVIKHIPAVVLYSHICKSIDQVPEEYRSLVQREQQKYASWDAMKVLVAKEVKVLEAFSFN